MGNNLRYDLIILVKISGAILIVLYVSILHHEQLITQDNIAIILPALVNFLIGLSINIKGD